MFAKEFRMLFGKTLLYAHIINRVDITLQRSLERTVFVIQIVILGMNSYRLQLNRFPVMSMYVSFTDKYWMINAPKSALFN